MKLRQTEGSVLCYSCNKLVQVDSERCLHCGIANPALWGYSRWLRKLGLDFGFTKIVIGGCLGLYLITLLVGWQGMGGNSSSGLSFLSPNPVSLFLFGSTGAIPVFELGRWWTIISSGWLHGGLLHIAFNLLWLHRLTPAMSKAYGAARIFTIYLVATMTGAFLTSWVGHTLTHLPSFLQGAQVSIGASGGVFGFLGALVSYGQTTKHYSILRQARTYTLVFLVIGFLWPRTDNWGHIGGFIGGYLITQTPWFNAQTSQKLHDILIAGLGLVLVILSILVSIGHGLLLMSLMNG